MRHNLLTLSVMGFSVILLTILFAVIGNYQPPIEIQFTDIPARDLYVELPKITHTPTPTLIEIERVEEEYQTVLITYKRMELTSLGKYYLTAYCPSECGYNGNNYPVGWKTASDTICHRASYDYRLSEPTTCAISRSIHSFGTEFYIPYFDRTFVAEDTGPGVKGKHLDLFYEDYSDVCSFPTGYYEVYKVTWVEETVAVSEEDLRQLKECGATEFFLEKESRDEDSN